jgi:hypothetical protein
MFWPPWKRITGYATLLGFLGQAVAETNLDLQSLIASVEVFAGPGIIVPTRNSELFLGAWRMAFELPNP